MTINQTRRAKSFIFTFLIFHYLAFIFMRQSSTILQLSNAVHCTDKIKWKPCLKKWAWFTPPLIQPQTIQTAFVSMETSLVRLWNDGCLSLLQTNNNKNICIVHLSVNCEASSVFCIKPNKLQKCRESEPWFIMSLQHLSDICDG